MIRFENIIYFDFYGVEIDIVFGKDLSVGFIEFELLRVIIEVLIYDECISDVSGFDIV